MKFNIGSYFELDTNDRYHPVKVSDGIVDVLYYSTAGVHGYQAWKSWTANNTPMAAYHTVHALIAAYWPYQISHGLTHSGLGHASYGLVSAALPWTPARVFGDLMVLDKVINWGDLKWPNGARVVPMPRTPLNNYGVDNLFLDNALIPTAIPVGIAVNLPWVVGLSALELMSTNATVLRGVKYASLAAGIVTGADIWLAGQNPRIHTGPPPQLENMPHKTKENTPKTQPAA